MGTPTPLHAPPQLDFAARTASAATGLIWSKDGVLFASATALGIAAPMQITAVHMTLMTLFPKICSNMTTSLLNGSYDTSGIGFAIWSAIGVALSGTVGVAGNNTKDQAGFVASLYLFLGVVVGNLAVVLGLYPRRGNPAADARPAGGDGELGNELEMAQQAQNL